MAFALPSYDCTFRLKILVWNGRVSDLIRDEMSDELFWLLGMQDFVSTLEIIFVTDFKVD